MIKANELRYGNWVNYKGEPIRVTSVGQYGIQSINEDSVINAKFSTPDITGISLTPELLEKCGFRKEFCLPTMPEYFDHRLGNMVINTNPKWDNVEVEYGGLSLDDRTHICKIQSLHQLQNIYFALTQTELTIKI